MLIGVISDSHGNRKRIYDCLPQFEGVDHILHAGDFYEDAKIVSASCKCKVTAVTGNCDYMVRGPVEEMLILGGKKVYLTHGHLYKVKRDFTLLFRRAKGLEAQIAVFGHTHFPQVFYKEKILFVNPGSLHSPRQGYQPSVAMIDTSKRRPKAEILFLK